MWLVCFRRNIYIYRRTSHTYGANVEINILAKFPIRDITDTDRRTFTTAVKPSRDFVRFNYSILTATTLTYTFKRRQYTRIRSRWRANDNCRRIRAYKTSADTITKVGGPIRFCPMLTLFPPTCCVRTQWHAASSSHAPHKCRRTYLRVG